MNLMSEKVGGKLRETGAWMVLVMAVALIISTALIGISTILILILCSLLVIFEPSARREFANILKSPVVLLGFLLFFLMVIRNTFAPSESPESWGVIAKYRELILFPMLLLFINQLKWKRRVYYTFLTLMGFVVMHSWLQFFGLSEQLKPDQINSSIVGRISGALMLAFVSFVYLEESIRFRLAKSQLISLVFLLLFLMGSIALLFFFDGRSGIVVYAVISLLWGWRLIGFKGILLFLFVFVLSLVSAVYIMPNLEERVLYTVSEFNALGYIDFTQHGISRSEFYSKIIYLMPNVLPFGGGAGSFGIDFMWMHLPLHVSLTNPHNEYLLMLYENGVLGLVLLCGIFILAWMHSSKENESEKWLIRSLVLTMAIGCCFNSLMLDLKEAHFYMLMLASLMGVGQLEANKV